MKEKEAQKLSQPAQPPNSDYFPKTSVMRVDGVIQKEKTGL